MQNKSFQLFAFLLILSFLGPPAAMAKRLPKAVVSSKAGKKFAAPSGVVISAKLRGDRRAINLYMSNLNLAQAVSYTLSYDTNGKGEGIGGSVDPKGIYSTSRELVFGTASSGVYRYHSNITGAKLEVIATLKSGKKIVKRFKIKV